MSRQTTPLNFMAGHVIDRAPKSRKDPAWCASILAHAETLAVPIYDQRVLIKRGHGLCAVFPKLTELKADQIDQSVILGIDQQTAYVAVSLGGDQADLAKEYEAEFFDLRRSISRLPRQESALLAYARAMLHWHEHHRFCGRCGAPTRLGEGGGTRTCGSPDCGMTHFPRTDPAIIVSITHENKILLARAASWPPTVYAVIAGFAEPGESLEDAVARETLEETGLDVYDVQYHSSQPWPFPGSIMIGFMAKAKDTDFHLDDDELEHAEWLTREDIERRMRAGSLRLPSGFSISYNLVETWFDQDHAGRLATLKKSLAAK